jgi:hypothetical protein
MSACTIDFCKSREPLMHKNYMRSSRNIRMYGHWKHEFIVFSVEVVEVVHPDLLDIPWVDPSMTVRTVLHEHHRRQIVDIP